MNGVGNMDLSMLRPSRWCFGANVQIIVVFLVLCVMLIANIVTFPLRLGLALSGIVFVGVGVILIFLGLVDRSIVVVLGDENGELRVNGAGRRNFRRMHLPGGMNWEHLQLLMDAQGRDFGPDDYERLLALDEDTPTKQLQRASEMELSRLPTITFHKSQSGSEEDGSHTCKICLEDFEEEEQLRLLPCFHKFHLYCADRWLQEKAECPICKTDIRGHQTV